MRYLASFAAVLLGLMAQSCDDTAVPSSGSNTSAPSGAGGAGSDVGLGRGHAAGGAGLATAAGGTSGSGTAGRPGAAGGTAGSAGGTTAVGTGGVKASGVGGTTAVGIPNASGTGGASGGATPAASGGMAVSGTGGASATGSGGVPGSGGNAMSPDRAACAQYAADYKTALDKAKECKGKANSCSKLVPAALSGCNAACNTYVEDDDMLNDLRQKWVKAGCLSETCAAVVCISTSAGTCDMSDGAKDDRASMKGTCSGDLIVL